MFIQINYSFSQCYLAAIWHDNPASCPFSANGELCCDSIWGLTPGTGLPPYTCNIVSPAGTYTFNGTSDCFTGLLPGFYNVAITSIDGCIGNFFNLEVESLYDEISLDAVNVTPAACAGNDGSLCVTIGGGSGGYSYEWTGPPLYNTPIGTNANCLNGLGPNFYQVVVSDNAFPLFCQRDLSLYVSGTTLLDVEDSITYVSCATGTEGSPCTLSCFSSIDLTVTTGTAPFTYTWTGPNGYTANTQDLSAICDGTYNVLVTDANGCTFNGTYQVGPQWNYDVNGDVIINMNTTWNAIAPYGPVATINGNIIINPGATLTLNGITVELPRGKAIRTVGSTTNIGGILDATGCIFTSVDPLKTWRGFEVLGVGSNPTIAQIAAGNRSLLWLKNCEVRHAEIGIRNTRNTIGCEGSITYPASNNATNGGRILCSNTWFHSNVQDVNLNRYTPQDELNTAISGLATFNDCLFELDNFPSCREIKQFLSSTERISLGSVTGVYFYSCDGLVSNVAYTTGINKITKLIRASNSWFDWRGCDQNGANCNSTIIGFYQGITALGQFTSFQTGIVFASPDPVVLIDHTTFQCRQGVYWSGDFNGISSMQIILNTFQDIPAAYGNIPGTSAENTRVRYNGSGTSETHFFVNANTFTTAQTWLFQNPPPAPFRPVAISVTSGGTSNNNFTYSNIFNGFYRGINCSNRNRDPLLGTNIGLHYECNDFINCRNDINIEYPSCVANQRGVAENQEWYYPIWAPGFSAGNKFVNSAVGGIDNDDIARVLPAVGSPNTPVQTYAYHLNELNANTIYEMQYEETALSTENLATSRQHVSGSLNCVPNILQHPCPGNVIYPPFAPGGEQQMIAGRTGYEEQQALVAAILDGGNTQALLAQTNTTNYYNAYQTYQGLMQQQGKLSDEVMIAAIQLESELPASWLTNVLATNPHATASVAVMDALQNRYNPLDEYQMMLIREGSTNTMTPLQVAKRLMGHYRYEEVTGRSTYLQELNSSGDVLTETEILTMYHADEFLGDRLQAASLLRSMGQFESAQSLLNSASQALPLSAEEEADITTAASIYEIEHIAISQQESLLTPTQLAWLEDIWLNDPYNMGPLALQVLMSLAGYEPEWTDYEVPAELRSMQGMLVSQKQSAFTAYPNPVSDFINIKRSGTTEEVVMLEIQSVDARIVGTDKFNTTQSEISFLTNQLAEGAYVILLKNEQGKLLERIQFIKVN